MTRELRAYYLANVAFLVPSGIATIAFPWLVVNVLNESPTRVGIAQMISQLPALVFLLLAGLVADRVEQRRILVVTHILVALGQLGIVALIVTDTLTFEYLIALAVFTGIAGTFSGPPRDALLTRVADGQIQRTVLVVIGLQFGAQIAGFLFAGVADRIGGAVLLSVAALIFALGAIPCLLLPSSEPGNSPRGHPLRDIAVGLRVAMQSRAMAPALVLTFALGIFFIGSFVVLLPLIVRDVYQGGAAELSIAFSANMTGTLVVIGVLMRRARIQRQGRAFMVALLFGSAVLSLLYLRPPYWAFILLSFVWGLGGGFTMTMGRSIVQEAAPPELAARLVSIYGFAMSAGMPIGSIGIGKAVDAFGTLNAALLPAAGMALTILVVHLTSDCWRLGAEQPGVQQAA
jgi:MFS family permease